jgi:hypothetical protein
MIADASRTTLASVAEVTAGTTPSTPTMQKMRFTGGSGLQVVQDFVTSNEIRPDRNIPDRVRVGRRTEASYNFEASYGTYDEWLESLLQSSWSTNTIANGVTSKFFTLEEIFQTDTGSATDQYKRAPGMQVNTMTLAIQANQIVTGSFGLIGFGVPTLSQAPVSGATYNDPNDNPVLSASNDFGSLTATGLTSPKVQSINLSITNNLRSQPVVGSIDGVGIGSGRFDVTGDITMYFENDEAYDLFLANTYTDLTFRIGGASTLKYVFTLPKIKFTEASLAAAGNDTDVPLTLQFGAVYDSSEGHALEIVRTPS